MTIKLKHLLIILALAGFIRLEAMEKRIDVKPVRRVNCREFFAPIFRYLKLVKVKRNIDYAMRKNYLATVEKLIKDNKLTGDDFPADWLFKAIYYDQVELVKLLLSNGANPNRADDFVVDFLPPIILAVHQGKLPIINLLLTSGVDVDQVVPVLQHYCMGHQVKWVRTRLNLRLSPLINFGPGTDASLDPYMHPTLLTCVIALNIHQMVKSLLFHGASVNNIDKLASNDNKFDLRVCVEECKRDAGFEISKYVRFSAPLIKIITEYLYGMILD